MSILSIFVVLIIGMMMLAVGLATNKKWLKSLSVIPIALSLFRLLELFSMGL